MRTVVVAFGTRPEAIKLAPVIRLLSDVDDIRVCVVNVGQHAEVLDETIAAFGITPDYRLDVMRRAQPLATLTSRALQSISEVLEKERPEMVIGQGDTTTVMASALAAFYYHIPFAHVEAGLRTGIRDLPFPEEMNRRLTGTLSTLHFAPTDAARDNLLREGVDPSRIEVTGNTVIDALFWMLKNGPAPESAIDRYLHDPRRLIAVTAHRRESWGAPLEEIAAAISEIARADPDVFVVFPVHPNPTVRSTMNKILRGLDNVEMIEALPYQSFVHLMNGAYILLTDSGGIQEEAAALHKPVLVMRDVTERSEGIAVGTAELVGRKASDIVCGVRNLLDDPAEYRARCERINPYGDGRAAERIVRRVTENLRTG